MKEIVKPEKHIRKAMKTLETKMRKISGVKLGDDCGSLQHKFGDGLYIREITMSKGMLIISKLHKTTHPYFVLKGDVSVLTENGVVRIKAPYSGFTKAGTKRVLYIHEETVWTTVHFNPTDTQDLDKIEEETIAPSFEELKKFQALNRKQNNSGIYIICNSTNEKIYIGSSKNIKNRWKEHKHQLNKNIHSNQKLQNAWNKYGEKSFSFVLIENIKNEKQLIQREQYWIDKTAPVYNICHTAGRTDGIKQSKQQRERTSKFMLGNKYAIGKSHMQTPETRTKISATLMGRKHSAESYARQAETLRGYKHTEKAKKNMSNIKHTDESKEKISKARKLFIKENPNNNTCFKKRRHND